MGQGLWEKELGPGRNSSEIFVRAMQFALYQDAAAGEKVKKDLLRQVASPPRQFYSGTLDWTAAAAYDLTYELYSAEERAKTEQALLDSCRGSQRGAQRVGPPNLCYICYWEAGVIACAIGNDEIIDWSLNSPGRSPG